MLIQLIWHLLACALQLILIHLKKMNPIRTRTQLRQKYRKTRYLLTDNLFCQSNLPQLRTELATQEKSIKKKKK